MVWGTTLQQTNTNVVENPQLQSKLKAKKSLKFKRS
jgi:hypothetical protein